MDGSINQWINRRMDGADGQSSPMGFRSFILLGQMRDLSLQDGVAVSHQPTLWHGLGLQQQDLAPELGLWGYPRLCRSHPFTSSLPLGPSFCSCTPKRTAGMPGCRGAPHKAEKPPAVGCPPLEGAVVGLGAACPSPASPAPSPKRP